MPGKQVKNWSQYEAIKRELIEDGLSEKEAKIKAARIVNATYTKNKRHHRRVKTSDGNH